MNRPILRPPRHASPVRVSHGKAAVRPCSITAWTFLLLFAAACVCADVAAAAPGQFDGNYKGMFTLINGGCVDSKLEQVMVVSGDRVYVDRKSLNTDNPLTLSGTVGPDGSVSAAGTTTQTGGGGYGLRTAFFTLIGRIANGEFVGELSNRGCSYAVKLKR